MANDDDPDTSGSVPVDVDQLDSQPVSSGRVKAVATETSGRSKRSVAAGVVSGGVEALGSAVGSIGEGVSKVGAVTRKIPLVGSSVSKLGEGLTSVGESVQALPGMTRTRGGRLLLRSALVGFTLVFAWITVIVALQLRSHDTPDFRTDADEILAAISRGGESLDKVYEEASPKFQDMVRKERFLDDMNDMTRTLGRFREIASINETIVTDGPFGRVGRVSIVAVFDKAKCRGSVSFHRDDDEWKLLGVGMELPPSLPITQAEREARVEACKDPLAADCDIHVVVEKVLAQLRDGQAGEVWDAASPIFQKQEERDKFIAIQDEHRQTLGPYLRLLDVTEAREVAGTAASYEAVAEYERGTSVHISVALTRASKTVAWQLRAFKIVMPMPRVEDRKKK